MLLAPLIPPAAAAERYPERPVRLVVPFAPGGGVDINARILAMLNQATVASLNAPGLKRVFVAQGLNAIASSAAGFAPYLDAEIKKWTRVVHAAKIMLQ